MYPYQQTQSQVPWPFVSSDNAYFITDASDLLCPLYQRRFLLPVHGQKTLAHDAEEPRR